MVPARRAALAAAVLAFRAVAVSLAIFSEIALKTVPVASFALIIARASIVRINVTPQRFGPTRELSISLAGPPRFAAPAA
ncbi:hypothetical protein D4Q52_19775 [Rhodopseudomonas palustris]|uniref:Uncharacterized protein n=1 Tax=Rhodopseudomonas palustris TaxID=1076 RepID=A0A418V1A2_RHOPL|nr:hypothetical protein D4Q52_19775 [Rhodopseudomonas palustris]